MAEPNAAYRSVLLAELELHKAEFTQLREEIIHSIDAERQALNLSIVAVGAGLGFATFVMSQNALIILLLFPFVFHVILWEMFNSSRDVSHISNYLTGTLIPRVNAILDELGDNRHDSIAFGWEIHIATLPIKKRELLISSLTPTRHWMPILAIAALLIAYSVLASRANYSPLLSEIVLLLINLILLAWAAIQNTMTTRSSLQQASKLRQIWSRDDTKTNDQQDTKPPRNDPKK
jgi:uncharacterized membrane protein YoaK (UPF0700 family)